jgi:hypothetical protein
VNFKFRMAPAVTYAKRIVSAPIGPPFGQLAMNSMPGDIWVRDPVAAEVSSSPGLPCSGHDLLAKRVRASARLRRWESDALLATVRFANGAVASLLLADAGRILKWASGSMDFRRQPLQQFCTITSDRCAFQGTHRTFRRARRSALRRHVRCAGKLRE